MIKHYHHCAPDNFACLWDSTAYALQSSPGSLAYAVGLGFALSIILAVFWKG